MSSLDIAALLKWIGSDNAHSKIWIEGFSAARLGAGEDTNPYVVLTDGLIWLDGWSLYQSCPSLLDQ